MQAVLSVLQAFGYQLPLRLHVWVGGLSILGIAAFSHARCGAELGAVDGMAGRYGALAGQLSRMGRLDVTSHGTRHAALPSDLEACWLANTYAMVRCRARRERPPPQCMQRRRVRASLGAVCVGGAAAPSI